ncbi:unnamed protein product, partial [Closterium sp. NIES-65]
YEDVGVAVVQKLDGIFAFVLLNTKDGSYLAVRDPIGVCPLYIGWGRDGSLWFASEMKAVKDDCEQFETFPPGSVSSSKAKMPRRWYNPAWYDEHIPSARPAWYDEHIPSAPYDPIALRAAFEKAVVKRLMTDVPFGVLLSGGLDSSLVAAVAQSHLGEQWGPQLHSYCIGLEDAPDLRAAREVADFIGTNHHELHFTVQEGIDAVSEVIYHTETFDVATIRASTPMFLLSRKIKALGVKMVLSGEGSDEVFGGYLYFHKAPSKEDFHRETCHKLKALHMYDCVRAKKATSAWGLEVRVPFLDKESLDVAMSIDPQYKMIRKRDRRIGKWHILYRQKEQFSDGVGYSWIDGLKAHAERMVSDQVMANAPNVCEGLRQSSALRSLSAHAERMVSDQMMANASDLFMYLPPKTKEALVYRRIFEKHFPQLRLFKPLHSSSHTSRPRPRRRCSTAAYLKSTFHRYTKEALFYRRIFERHFPQVRLFKPLHSSSHLFTYNPPKTKEALFYRRIFERHFPQRSACLTVPGGPSVAVARRQRSARLTVPGGPSVACSTAVAIAPKLPPFPLSPIPTSLLLSATALCSSDCPWRSQRPSVACSTAAGAAWDAAWRDNLDPSGRAALGVHAAAFETRGP